MNKYGKFAILMAIIVGSLSFLAYSGIKGSTTYYKTITELRQMGGEAQTRHVRVGGDVQGNSITHIAGAVKFKRTRRDFQRSPAGIEDHRFEN